MKKLFIAAQNAIHYGFLCLIVSLSVGCAIAPDSIVKQPTTAKPQPVVANTAKSGAIFNNSAYKPLFEDRKARNVGDILTVTIAENTSATKANGDSGSKDGKAEGGITKLLGKAFPKTEFSASSSTSYEGKNAANASNVFNGSVTATVTEVLANGNLVVAGEKQVSFDKSTEFVRFSGVVNPDTITAGNVVTSTKIADARIEYRTSSKVDLAEVASMFARFFLSMAAF
ncbi:MAG TPA: flagellar basal body L-ring protein FlgH [Methylotenera sp.]|nr:flagellar basal body L-ring protein FlgH [Methylotenera sp.]HPH04959.1 flagellar basal body L-ring protein FlgH [Methylotenera sp.]HPN00221.1 flagellar basal body L-ring protein FlgH [Methylotenera sp.]